MSKLPTALPLPRGAGPRLFLLLVVAIVAIAIAADAWRLRQERTRVLAQLQREASLVTQAIEGQVVPVPRDEDDGRLAGLLEDIREAKDAECVGLYSLAGQRVRAVFRPDAVDRASAVCAATIAPRLTAGAVAAHWGVAGTYNVQVAVTPADTPEGILKLVFDAERVSGPLGEFRTGLLVERALVLLAMGVTLWLGIVVLVTRPIRRLIDKLDEAQRLAAVGKLASVIAHEIGTPLHVIAGRARHLERRLPHDDCSQADVATIREQVGRITRTMQHVLQSSRAIPARREPVDLDRLVLDAAQVVLQEYAVRSVDIVVSVPAGFTIVADTDRLTGLMLNLLSNALAATPAGGRVDVRATATTRDGRAGVALTVTDTGTGIAPEHRERIFEPFFSTKPSGGTGLGLSICRDIVHAHEGIITAASAQEGGACFTVWLPLAPAEAPHG